MSERLSLSQVIEELAKPSDGEVRFFTIVCPGPLCPSHIEYETRHSIPRNAVISALHAHGWRWFRDELVCEKCLRS